MADGRTTFHPKDDAWWTREHIVILGEEFGPAGPGVMDVLECAAGAQWDGGRVRTGFKTVSRASFVNDVDLVERIILRAVELEALDEFVHERHTRFTARISGMEKDRSRANAARRQAEKRSRDVDQPDPCHAPSRSVTPRHAPSRLSHDAPQTPPPPPVNGSSPPAAAAAEFDAPGSGATAVAEVSERLSRSVTLRHGASRSVTESHVNSTPRTTTPPLPPASGGRKRDTVRSIRDYELALEAFLIDHPCSDDETAAAEWAKVESDLHGRFPVGALTHSHPHDGSDEGTLLIGVHPDVLPVLLWRRNAGSKFGVLKDGRTVDFVACPSVRRSASAP